MDNITEFPKKHTMKESKSIIINNLQNNHHCKWVNWFFAINNLNDVDLASDSLQELIRDNVVQQRNFPTKDKFNRPSHVSLYRYNVIQDW